MKKTSKLSLILCLLLLVSGFSFSLNKANLAKQKGSLYQNLLGQELRRMANEEARKSNWKAAKYFANKSLDLFKGKDIQIYNPKGWEVSSETSKKELLLARKAFLEIEKEYKDKHPQAIARMAADYECWGVRQQSNEYMPIAMRCRENFFITAKKLGSSNPAKHIEKANEILNKHKIDPRKEVVYKKDILFEWNKTNIKCGEDQKINTVIQYLNTRKGDYAIILIGNADQTGSNRINQIISEKRAEKVKEALVALGVDDKKIKYYGLSRQSPVVDKNNKKVAANRRVEIYVVDSGYISSVGFEPYGEQTIK